MSRSHGRARSSAGEHSLHTGGVASSILAAPTTFNRLKSSRNVATAQLRAAPRFFGTVQILVLGDHHRQPESASELVDVQLPRPVPSGGESAPLCLQLVAPTRDKPKWN